MRGRGNNHSQARAVGKEAGARKGLLRRALGGRPAVLLGAVFVILLTATMFAKPAGAMTVNFPTESQFSVDRNSDPYEYANNLKSDGDVIKVLDDVCGRFNNRGDKTALVAQGIYVYGAKLDQNNGTVTYNIETLAKRCYNPGYQQNHSPQLYAITGYAYVGAESATCPVSGWYHDRGAPTHDCMKFQKANPNLIPTQWDNIYGKCNNVPAVSPAPVNTCAGLDGIPGNADDSNVWSQVFKQDDPPTPGVVYSNSFAYTQKIPNWSVVKSRSGNHTLLADGQKICGFWLIDHRGADSNWGTAQDQVYCQAIKLSVSWTYDWSASDSAEITSSTSDNYPGKTITWKHTVKNNGPNDMADTNVITRYWNDNGAANDTGNWFDQTTANQNPWVTYDIEPATNTGYSIDIQSVNTDNGSKIRVWPRSDIRPNAAQLWTYQTGLGNRLMNPNSGKCLDVKGAGTDNGTIVQLYDCNGGANQSWFFSPDGSIRNRSVSSNVCLDRKGGTFDGGTSLQIYQCNGSAAQQWKYNQKFKGVVGGEWIGKIDSGKTRTFDSTHLITQDDVGSTLCRRTSVNRKGYNMSADDGWWSTATDNEGYFLNSTPACVHAPYNYQPPTGGAQPGTGITPTTALKSSATIIAGTDAKFGYTGVIKAQQRYTKSNPALRANIYVCIDKSASINSSYIVTTAGKDSAPVGNMSGTIACSDRITSMNPSANSAPKTTVPGTIYPDNKAYSLAGDTTVNTAGFPPGTVICSYAVLNNWWSVKNDVPAGNSIASNVQCVTIAKNPQMKILGADSRSGAKYWGDSSSTISPANDGGFSGTTFPAGADNAGVRGSWSQYGLLANGGITGFGSAGYTDMDGGTAFANFPKTCALWFANTGGTNNNNSGGSDCGGDRTSEGGHFGESDRTISLPLAGKFGSPSAPVAGVTYNTTDANITSMSSGTYYYSGVGGALTVGSGGTITIPAGAHVTIYSPGNISINANIKFASVSSADQIPSLTVFAGRYMSIKGNVNDVAGTYISGVTFQSCSVMSGSGPDLGENGDCASSNTHLKGTARQYAGDYGLKVNGAIVSHDFPAFSRTYGGGSGDVADPINGDRTNPSDPAEIINYTPASFLSAYCKTAPSACGGSAATAPTTTPSPVAPSHYVISSEISLPARY